jgi:hypothetical protein
MSASLSLSATDRFALSIDGLCKAVAARSFRGMLAGALIILIWSRIRKIEVLFQAVAKRVLAGVADRKSFGRKVGARVGLPLAGRGLPLRFGWLLQLVPHEAGCFASQIETVLGEAEMVAVLSASPRARRVLAPLCRMLGIAPGVLTPGAVLAPVVLAVEAVVKRVRVARAPIDFGRIPLPRGVLAAARRQGFGKRF